MQEEAPKTILEFDIENLNEAEREFIQHLQSKEEIIVELSVIALNQSEQQKIINKLQERLSKELHNVFQGASRSNQDHHVPGEDTSSIDKAISSIEDISPERKDAIAAENLHSQDPAETQQPGGVEPPRKPISRTSSKSTNNDRGDPKDKATKPQISIDLQKLTHTIMEALQKQMPASNNPASGSKAPDTQKPTTEKGGRGK